MMKLKLIQVYLQNGNNSIVIFIIGGGIIFCFSMLLYNFLSARGYRLSSLPFCLILYNARAMSLTMILTYFYFCIVIHTSPMLPT